MHIDQYRFGHVDIEGHSYDADVIIFPGHVKERWWRQEGHSLAREDLATVLAEKPELLVVGTRSWTEKTLVESGRFYPPDVHTAEAPLRFYASEFPVVEVDSSY